MDECTAHTARGEPPPLEPLSHDQTHTVFKSFERYINGISETDEWLRDTGDRVERIVYSNYCSLPLTNELSSLLKLADTLSVTDATQLVHYREHLNLVPFQDEVLAGAIKCHVQPTPRVPKLTMLKFPNVKREKRVPYDVPNSLGGPLMFK